MDEDRDDSLPLKTVENMTFTALPSRLGPDGCYKIKVDYLTVLISKHQVPKVPRECPGGISHHTEDQEIISARTENRFCPLPVRNMVENMTVQKSCPLVHYVDI